MQERPKVVIGGGAAGFFGAINLAEKGSKVLLLEKNRQVLSKVKISGGGRCNVTNATFEPKELIKNYPRGSRELLGPFHCFGPTQTVEWFQNKGVDLKIEEDKRMFPVTNTSQTIIDCLTTAAKELGVKIQLGAGVASIEKIAEGFKITLENTDVIEASAILMATGSSTKMWKLLESQGHSIKEPVASLFTLNIPSSPFLDIAGISLEKARVFLEDGLEQTGPLLFTHWGLSGPAVLKLSAWAARSFYESKYYNTIGLDFIPDMTIEQLSLFIDHQRQEHGSYVIRNYPLNDIPRRLWDKLIAFSDIKSTQVYAQISTRQKKLLVNTLKNYQLFMEGKTTYKEEFVTCGGVQLDEVDFQTMESKKVKGLYFAGEVLDIDGVTGGFNFQAAWTTSYIAAFHM